MKIFNKNWFTFIELVVSVTISVVIFIIIFSFVVDAINNLTISNKKAIVLSNFYDIYDKIWDYRNIYISWSIIIDNPYWVWNDVALIKNNNNDKWLLFWVIDKDTMKIDSWSTYDKYTYKVFWYKQLNLSELYKVESNSWEVYNISFKGANIFDTPIKTFHADLFNSWWVFLVDLELLIAYNKNLEWKSWSSIPLSEYELFKLAFNF